MKTSIITLTTAIWIILFSNIAIAHNPNQGVKTLNQELQEQISYPEFAKSLKMDGLVLVEFQVTEKGKIEVNNMNASCPQLAEYVNDQLASIWIDGSVESGTHYVKFNFHFIES